MIREFYQAFFIENGEFDMKDPAQVLQVALKSGLSQSLAQKCLEASQTDEIKAALKASSVKAVELGAFGVPTTFVYSSTKDEPTMFFGCDRNEYIADALGYRK